MSWMERETGGALLLPDAQEKLSLRQFLVASHALFATGLVSLLLAEGQGPYVAVGLAACLLSAWGAGVGRNFMPVVGDAPLAGLLALWALADVFFVSRSVLIGSCHLMILLQAVKLLQRKTTSDYWLLYLVSFVQLVMAAAVTVSMAFALVFPAYLVVAAWALRLLHLRLELERAADECPEERGLCHGRLACSRVTFGRSTSVALGVLLVGLVIFLALPRISLGLMSLRSPLAVVLSGFSRDVKLGDIGRILLSSQVVMRVKLPEPVGHLGNAILWRGVVLDQYAGGGWRARDSISSFVGRSADGLFHLPGVPEAPENALLRQDIVAEAMEWPVLFAAFRPARVEGKFRWIRVDANGAISGLQSHRGGLSYTVWSVMPPSPSVPVRKPKPLSPQERARYLQLPALSSRFHELARDVVRDATDGAEAAYRIADYLLTNYAYSLEMRSTAGMDPVEDFLFRRRAGHCEYFASAMAVMLRAVGVPSRVVNGFRGADWNSYGNYYVVRERNAHAWVEAYIPEQGWVTFDPTPPSSVSTLDLPSFFVSLSQLVDTFRWRWHRHVIDFDASSQKILGTKLMRHVSQGLGGVSGWWNEGGSIWRAPFGIRIKGGWLLAFGLVAGLVALIFVRRPRAFRFSRRDGVGARADFYARLLKLLARWGYVRKSWCTPRELARWVVAHEGEKARAVEELTEMYYRVRYGGHRLEAGERRVLDEHIRALEVLKGTRAGRTKGLPIS